VFQRSSVLPVRQRLENILASRIRSPQKPYIGDSHRRQCPPRFNLPYRSQSPSLFGAYLITTAASASPVRHGNALSLIDRPRKIRRRRPFIIRVRHHQQYVGLISRIRRRKGLGLLRTAARRRPQQKQTARQP
jgi:hypothetical protein